MTPYKLTKGSDYNRPVCVFGEQVLAKVPVAESKLGRKWLKGVWLGKLERDDSHVIGTSAGAIAVRSVRRLPKAEQVGTDLMAEMRGLPWKPRDGHRKVTRESSEVVVMLGQGPPEAGDGAFPLTAEDGAAPDAEALQRRLEEPPLLEDQVPPSPIYSPSIGLPGTPPRGGARVSPPEAMSAESELKRDAPPASAEPSSPSKALRVADVTALEVWEAIQKWGESDEQANPFAIQQISNVADYVDQLLDPDKVHEARKVQLEKLWKRAGPA